MVGTSLTLPLPTKPPLQPSPQTASPPPPRTNPPDTHSIPILRRKIAVAAAAASTKAARSRLVHTGMSNDSPNERTGWSAGTACAIANQIDRFRITPTTAAVIADSAPASALVAAQRLDVGRAEEDPEEAGDEGDPGRQQSAKRGRQHRRQRAGIAIGGHEADELQHHDQRARRGLGHAEAVEHLARLQPVIMLDRLLGDIGQHRIGAAERHHRHLGEEQRDLAEHVGLPEPDQQRGNRHHPQQQPHRTYAQRAADARAHVIGQFLAEQAVDRGRLLVAAAVFDGGEFRPSAASRRNSRSRRPR